MDRDLPDGAIDPDGGTDPHRGRDELGDDEVRERSTEAAESELLLTDAALSPDDPVTGEAVRRGADPDMVGDADRGEEP